MKGITNSGAIGINLLPHEDEISPKSQYGLHLQV